MYGHFGNWLKEKRKYIGCYQRDIAEKAGISKSRYSVYERNPDPPRCSERIVNVVMQLVNEKRVENQEKNFIRLINESLTRYKVISIQTIVDHLVELEHIKRKELSEYIITMRETADIPIWTMAALLDIEENQLMDYEEGILVPKNEREFLFRFRNIIKSEMKERRLKKYG